MPIPLRGDFDAETVRAACQAVEGRASGAAASGAGGDLRRRDADGSREDRRRDAADRSRLGDEVQRPWPGRADRPQGAGPTVAAQRHASAALVTMIESGPIPAVHGVVRWRLVDLCQWIYEEFRITVAKQTLSRELRAMGYRKLTARPRHHAQTEGAIEDFKKAFPRAWKKSRTTRASIRPHRSLVRR